MTAATGRHLPTGNPPARPHRKRHLGRWLLAGLGALIALTVAAAAAFVKLQPAAAPLALPAAAAGPATGPLAGTWQAAAGSVAGFRVPEEALGMTNDVTGRTHAVSGTVVIAGGRITAAVFRIDLAAIKVNGKTQPQFTRSLSTRSHPVATFRLTRPVPLTAGFAGGAVLTARAAGDLTLRGITRPVTFTFSGRRDGPALAAAGSAPIAFTRWGISGPAGFGPVGSLASHGTAEVLLVLHHR